MNQHLINECKVFIEINDLAGLQSYYNEIHNNTEFDYNPNWQFIYQKVYLHACLKKKNDIVSWLISIFNLFDPVSQIALRGVFPYGRYLLGH